jgi:succinate dehydrogenase / fumarate reductase cytochrome b subunit
MKKVGIYPGCCFQGADEHNYKITIDFLEKMGVAGHLLESAACCGGGVIDETNKSVTYALNARNIALAEKHNLDLYTPCNTCYMVIAKSKQALDRDPEMKAKVNEILAEEGLEYKGTATIYHTLNLIRDFIGLDEYKTKIVRKLEGVKVAPYYGCHVLSPEDISLDDPENPTLLREILEPCGVEIIEGYKDEYTCCGYHAGFTNPDVRKKLSNKPLDGAAEAGADVLVTPCPLCHKSMDAVGENEPVLQLTQIINVACGLSSKEAAWDLNKKKVGLSFS